MSETKTRSRLDDEDQSTRVATPPVKGPVRDPETVTVACKWPMGLILHLERKEDFYEPLMGGGLRKTERYVKIPESEVLIKGCAVDITALRSGILPEFAMVGGYALTPNVSKRFWDQWYDQNRDTPLVKNKVIFAAASDNEARVEAKDYASILSGLEPINPQSPASKSRELRGIQQFTKEDK